jgi:hypothetical protein
MFLVTHYWPDGSQAKYEKVRDQVQAAVGERPDGQVSHIAGPAHDGGWLVANVWETQDAWDTFKRDTLTPAFEQAGFSIRALEERKADVLVLIPA